MRKKFLLSKFLVLLILITGSVGVASAQTVAKIGDNSYSTFAAALTAANGMTGDVTVEIYGAGEFTDGMELNGSYTSINFIGKNVDAKLTVNQTAQGDYLEAHGKIVSFTDLILAKANPAWSNNSGHMGNYFSIQGGTVTYTGCTFPNGACTSGATANYISCTFLNNSEYGLWVYDDALVTVMGGTVDSKKGIKVYSEGEESVTSTLTVQNATFTANVTAKPAVAVGYAQSITLIGNTYNNPTAHVELDSGSDANCEGITFVAQDAEGNDIASTLKMTDRSNSNAPCGVLCDGKIYTTVTEAASDATPGSTVTLLYESTETVELPAGVILNKNGYEAAGITVTQPVAEIGETKYGSLQAAIDAAVDGDVVTLLADNAENVTVTQKPDVKFTIDGADKTMTGTITIDGKSAAYATAGITVKNMNFTAATEAVCINLGVSGNINNTRYTNNVTVESCNFTGTDKTAVGIKSYTGGDKNLIVNDCIATGMHSLMQLKNTAGVSVTECEITDSKNGISLGASSGVAINGTTVDCGGYGVRADANGDNGNATITDCTIEAFIPVVVRYASKDYALQFDGENTMTATNEDGLWCAIGTKEYETNGQLPTAPTGNVTVTLNDTGLSMDGVYGEHFALNGEGTAESPYLINNLYELKGFRDQVNTGNDYAGKYVKLAADINLNNEEWTPIGNYTNQFQGYFDGNEKTISNLKVTGNTRYKGFFGYIKGTGMSATTTPSVKDLTLDGVNVNVEGDGYYVGGLAGQAYTCNITKVTVKGEVSGVRYVGGLVGHVYTYFKDCHFIGNASCSFDALGGIAGAGDCRAYDCSVIGDVTGSNWVGGIVGNGQEGTSAVGCYVKGDVKTSTNWYFGVGGIAGVAGHGYSSSEFKNNYFDGNVYLEEEKVPAMIIGIVNADNNETINATIEGNSWNTTYYDVNIPVYVTAEPPQNGTTNWIASASEELTKPRNNNLVMLESDLQYVTEEDYVIMSFSEVTEEQVEQALINNAVAKIGETTYTTLQKALNAAAAGTGNVTVEIIKDIDLTGIDWNPVTVGAPTHPSVTVNGNYKTITGLNDMLFAGTWAGNSGLIINNLTIANSNIVNDKDDNEGTVGVGAFIGFPQASETITLNNCHLVNSTVEGGHWTGGLIGYAAGYAGTDGPVFMELTITGCSVTGSTITGRGSAGGIIGHGSGNAWTDVVIENTTVSNNIITSTGSSTNKAGAIMGTIGAAGQPTTVNGVTHTGGMSVSATVAENDVKSNGTEITTIYGRQGTHTGMLELNGGSYDKYPIEEGVDYAAPAEGYKIEDNGNGTYGVVVDPAYGKVAQIGDVYYETLAEAYTAATDGKTITLLNNITLDEKFVIAKSITLDGNNKTLTYTGEDRAIDIYDASNDVENVTIKNITIKFTSASEYCQRGINYNEGGYLTLDNVTVDGSSVVTYAVNLPSKSNNANVTITNSNITGKIALNVWGANAIINATGSHFTSVDDVEAENYAAVKLNNNGTDSAEGAVITITGGSITARDEKGELSSATTNATATGVINISQTTEVIGNIETIVAIVTYEGYSEFYGCFTLQEAIDKAGEDSSASATVKLLSNIETSVTVDKSVVLDLNGKTITSSDNTVTVDGGELTVVDNTEDKSGKIISTHAEGNEAVAVKGGGMFTLNSGNIEGASYGVYLYTSGGTGNINGGTITIGGEYQDGMTVAVASDECSLTVTDGTFTANGVNYPIYTWGENTIELKGGMFDFKPNSKYIANGYAAEAVADKDGWFKVVYVEPMITIEGGDSFYTLSEAFAAAKENDVISISKAGEYIWPSSAIPAGVTVKGTVDGVVATSDGTTTINATTLTVENVDFKAVNKAAFVGNGKAKNLTFIGCSFTGLYAFHVDYAATGAELNFNNCEFNGFTTFATTVETINFDGGSVNDVLIIRQDATIEEVVFSEDAVIQLGTSDQVTDKDITIADCTVEDTDGDGTTPDIDELINVNGNVADDKGNTVVVDNVIIYGGVAKIEKDGETTRFASLADALNAVQNEETITVLNVEGSEINNEIEFTKNITFTITGTAPNYALPIITFQNATVNISNAEILIPELDARQNATINVINSTIVDAGGNSIVKSYYNGAINIDANSTVYAMQVTTMGYITVAGTLNATWQTNVYGNGLITLNEGATFNTAALQLTGQDYSDRDNTDADRVGKPAEIVVDGANFTVGKVLSSNGADYSYNSSHGINVGTVEGKSAILNIKNGGNVNIYMANGETANIGAGGTVNIAASTLNTICRSAGGTVTLANNGTVNVSGESTLNIQTLTGKSIDFLDGAIINNSTIGGNVFVAGAVTFRGDNTFAMLYDYGTLTDYYGTTAPMKWNVEKGASVTLTNKARYGLGYGDEVTVIGNIENALTARENLSDDDRSLFMHGLVAQEASGWNCNSKLTVENAYVVLGSNNSFGNKPENYGGTYKFDFNNSVVDGSRITFYEANSQTEFTLTNSDVEIGTFMTRDANSKFILTGSKVLSTATTNGNDEGNYNAGELVLNNSTLTYNAAFTNTGVLNIGENSNVKAPTVINNGTINFTSLTSILETTTEGLVITLDSNYPDHKVVYKDGKYQVVEKDYVAQIGDDNKFETLQEAFDAATEGQTVTVINDVELESTVTVAAGKVVTLDLNGKNLTGGAYVNLYINGKLTIEDNVGNAVSTFRNHYVSEGGKLTLKSGILQNIETNTGGYGIFIENGGESIIEGGTVQAVNESNYAICVNGTLTIVYGNIVGKHGVIAVENPNANVTIKDGEYTLNAITGNSDHIVYVTAGMVNIEGGNFTFNNFIANEGDSMIDAAEENVSITGGTYTQDVNEWCAEGYEAVQIGENVYEVRIASFEKFYTAEGVETTQDQAAYSLMFNVTDNENNELSVKIGNKSPKSSAKLVIPSTLSFKNEELTVTSIPAEAFKGCTNFVGDLVIPATVEYIGDNAFQQAYTNSNEGNLILNEGLKTIKNGAFILSKFHNDVLEIPSTVTFIGSHAFNATEMNGTLVINGNVNSVGGFHGFAGSLFTKVVIKEGVTELTDISNKGVFATMAGLEEVVIPVTLTKLGAGAFSGVTTIKLITSNAETAPTLGASAFTEDVKNNAVMLVPNYNNYVINGQNWGGIKNIIGVGSEIEIAGKDNKYTMIATITSMDPMECSIKIGNTKPAANSNAELVIPTSVDFVESIEGLDFTVTSIPEDAFKGCNNFVGDLVIPAAVRTIEYMAFSSSHNANAGSLIFADDCELTTIGGWAFNNSFKGDFQLPASITSIGVSAFANNGAGKTLTITAENSGYGRAFAGSKFIKLVVEEGVKSLPGLAFLNTNFTEVVLPSTLETMNGSAFHNTKTITTITINAAVPPTVQNANNYNAFEQEVFDNATLFVPDHAAKALYREANVWKEFDKISTPIITQTTQLNAGWNWFSYYVDTDLETLENELGESAAQIKSHTQGFDIYAGPETWTGSLDEILPEQMYMINANEPSTLNLNGETIDHEKVEITLVKDAWNWIGYPINGSVNLSDAFNGVDLTIGDQIKSHNHGFAYYTGNNTWTGGLQVLVKGEGYMYHNTSDNNVVFTYNVPQGRSNSELKSNITTNGNYWIPNASQYPNNMTMTAMVDVEGGDYEVAAFVDGEVRGSARPIYVESIDAYVLFLTIHGEGVEEMTFKFYDLTTGEEFDLNDRMNYSDDAIVGSLKEPYMFNRGTTGIGEASLSDINIYPNPTTTGKEINLQATCDKVEVFNALGVKVAEYQNVDSIDALETAGIYVIRITNGDNVKHCSLVVK